jgi:hypothetical protein
MKSIKEAINPFCELLLRIAEEEKLIEELR